MDNSLGNKEIMAKNILKYMTLYGKDRKDVCRDLNISYTTFTDWVKGKTYPRIDKIELLANYFHVSKADLVEEHHTPAASSHRTLSPDESSLLDDYQKLNDLGKRKACDAVKDLTKIDDYRKDIEFLEDMIG
ncbi:MAG: helix-turn-helix transcriptional regulator [Eubacterium sp.]|nr:helix-turn-helix transcriptional regulator [Eubacterium sp.]